MSPRALQMVQHLLENVELFVFLASVNETCQSRSSSQLSMELMVAFRRRAVELAKRGIYLPEKEFRLLANDSGLPQKILKKVIDRWVQDGDGGPDFLDVIKNGRYALGKSHAVAQDLIISAGRKSSRKSRAAKMSIAKQQ